MKTRRGFVSNSSTTSFTCEVCGTTEAFHDSISHVEMGFYRCPNGHSLCEGELLNDSSVTTKDALIMAIRDTMARNSWSKQSIQSEINEYGPLEDWDEENLKDTVRDYCEADCTAFQCPICQYEVFSEGDLHKYLQKLTQITDDEVLDEVRAVNKRRRRIYHNDYIDYALHKLGMDRLALAQQIKTSYPTYIELSKHLKD